MKKELSFIKLMLLLILPSFAFSQSVMVKGKVTEENGDPLFGVNVLLKGTAQGVITDDQGEYAIQANIWLDAHL